MTAGAQALADRRREAGVAQPLLDQRRQHVLLGERLGADRVGRARLRQLGASAPSVSSAQPHAARRDPAALPPRQPDLHQRQKLIDREREHGGGDAAEQHEHPVLRLQAGEDVVAEARLADRRRQRGAADHPDRRGADARHDHRQRERQFDHGERLPARHADAERRLLDRRIDAEQSGDGVPQHRQHASRAPAPAPRAGSRARRSPRRRRARTARTSPSSSG